MEGKCRTNTTAPARPVNGGDHELLCLADTGRRGALDLPSCGFAGRHKNEGAARGPLLMSRTYAPIPQKEWRSVL
jgi:hypothetical protein